VTQIETTKRIGMKQAALGYAARGWHVFPLKFREKKPATKHGFEDAVLDPAAIEKMWQRTANLNVGIATEASGLLVIDVDMNPWKQKVGAQTWAILMETHDHVPTFTVQTWSGGVHYYYAAPEGGVKSGASLLGRDIDIRSRGGYVVAPPSRVSEDGNLGDYVVTEDLPVAPCPQWIIDMLSAEVEVVPHVPLAPAAAQERVLRRMSVLAAELREAPEGVGNVTAARVAYMAGQYVGAGQIDQAEVVGILMDAIADWTFVGDDQMDMTKTIITQVAAGAKNPRAWENPVSVTASTIADPFAVRATTDEKVEDPAKDGAGDEEALDKRLSIWTTDSGQAVFLRDQFNNVLFAVGIGWLRYDTIRWAPVPQEVIEMDVSGFYRRKFAEMTTKFAATMDDKWVKIAQAYRAFMSTARLKSIMTHLKITDGVLVDAAELDTHPELLNTPSCVVNLRTGEKLPHRKDYLFTKVTRGSYRGIDYIHKDWQLALTALDATVADYMQIRLGQAATGYIPESDDAMFFIGHGSNGKSLWASEGVLPALGDYGTLSPAELISRGKEGSGPSPERFGLRGVRLAVIEELPEGRSLSVAELKRVTGTPIITARDLHKPLVTFQASHTLVVTSNYAPVVSEVDEGSWRRLMRVNFPFKFTVNPTGVDERKGDPLLKGRIRDGKSGQHDAIITWMVVGALRHFAAPEAIMEGNRPALVQQATLEWRKEADRILAYIDERLVLDPTGVVAKPQLYDDFCRFLVATGHNKWTASTFWSRFMGHERIRNARIAQGQTRDHTIIDQPRLAGTTFSSTIPSLPAAPRILRGLRYNHD
jgi:putative DNA primase/helicase